jgi:hypothetical protein
MAEETRTDERPTGVESISHLDGCHFYCWVLGFPDGRREVTFDEREGSDLYLHGRFSAEGKHEACPRCLTLRAGRAKPRHVQKVIADYGPDTDAREGFLLALGTVGEIDEAVGVSDGT